MGYIIIAYSILSKQGQHRLLILTHHLKCLSKLSENFNVIGPTAKVMAVSLINVMYMYTRHYCLKK